MICNCHFWNILLYSSKLKTLIPRVTSNTPSTSVMQSPIRFRISSVQILIEDIEVFIMFFQKIEAFTVFT